KLREALSAYYKRRGSYPDTNDAVIRLCETVSRPACALGAVVRDDPSSTGSLPYWYASDGDTYAAFVSPAAAGSSTEDCPPNLPWLLAAMPLMCVRVSGDD